MLFLYSILLSLVLFVTLPYWVWRYVTTPKYQGTLRPRLGLDLPPPGNKPRIWLHAVSVGEAMAARGLVAELGQHYPQMELVVSTVTKTGQEIARGKLAPVAHTFYLPLDLPWIAKRVMKTIRPEMLLIMETELWPGLFAAAMGFKVPIIVINGRLSPNSFGNYFRFRWFMHHFLEPVHLFAMQSVMDAQRLEKLGVEGGRIRVTGNIKYDQALSLPDLTEMQRLESRLPRPGVPVIMAASTHRGEEGVMLRVFARLRAGHPTLRLILAPRHPERSGEVKQMLASLTTLLMTEAHGSWREDVLLVNQVGWLTRLYSYATLVYVGGSLIPHGGQNMLEPAAWGVAPVFGPHTFNFKDIVRQILENDAGVVVAGEEELFQAFSMLLNQEGRRRAMGDRARRVVEANAGALHRTMEEVKMLLSKHGHEPTAPPS